MRVGGSLEYCIPGHSTRFRLLPGNLLYMRRDIATEREFVDIDVYGRCWSFTIVRLRVGQAYVRRRGQYLTFGGTLAIFLPPFSIIEWRVMPGSFYFETLYFDSPVPRSFPAEPIAFPVDQEALPQTLEEVSRILEGVSGGMAIGREEKVSAIAQRAKRLIDETYMEGVSISDIARRLHCAHGFMSRSFRSCYGISPVAYRNKLRVTDSLRFLLMYNYSVSETAFSVGFEDLGQYNKHFRNFAKTIPSIFK